MPNWKDFIGRADGHALASLVAKLGDNTTAFWAAIGYEGATALASKLTAARAALLDQITALRMAELDAANLPADVDTLLARLTALRAGYLDELAAANIPADVDTLLARLTAVRAGYLDELAAANIPADVDTLLARLTAARALLLDQITALRMAELDPANIPADVDTLLARLTALRAGYLDFLATTEVAGPYSYLDAGGEQDVYANEVVTRRHVRVEFSNRNMTQTGTFRLYRMVDGANYDLYVSQAVLVAAGSERAFDAEFTTNQHWKLTYQENVDEGAARNIPYNVILQAVE